LVGHGGSIRYFRSGIFDRRKRGFADEFDGSNHASIGRIRANVRESHNPKAII